jgi:hypothetical protein
VNGWWWWLLLPVVVSADKTAVWVTNWQRCRLDGWVGAWTNPIFRKEGDGVASEMIRHAVAHTRDRWPEVPHLGLVTFIDPRHVRSRNPGYCYLMAGFRRVGRTAKGLHVLQLAPEEMPDPEPVPGAQAPLFGLEAS